MTRKLLVLLLIAGLLALPAAAAAAGKLTVAQEIFLVIPYSDYHYGMLCAQVKNTGDKPVQLNNGLLEIFDPQDNPIASVNLSSCYPPVLKPGASGFLYATAYIKEAKDKSYIADYSLSLTGQGAISYNVTQLPLQASYKTQVDGSNTYDYVLLKVENNTEAIAYDIMIPFALKDAGGKLVYAYYTQLYSIGLYPHSSLEINLQLDSSFVTYRLEQGIIPASVEAMAYIQSNK
jgi:hypothetical protein